MYRLAGKSICSGIAAPAELPAPAPAPVAPVRPELPHRKTQSETVDIHADVNVTSSIHMSAGSNTHPNIGEDFILPQSMDDKSLDISTDIWPWIEALNWAQDSGQTISNNWHTIMNHAQTDTTTAYRTSTEYDGIGGDTAPGKPGLPELSQALPQFHGSANGLGSGGNMDYPDVVIAQLSQLSMRLSPLRRSSYNLAEASESSRKLKDLNQACQEPQIHDATFESVAAWLVDGRAYMDVLLPSDSQYPSPTLPPETKTTGDVLHRVFSSSHHLLEILRYLRVNSVTSTSTLPKPSLNSSLSSYAPSKGTSSETSYLGLNKGSSSYATLSNQYSYNNNIILHLVTACHTMLLNIYVAVLTTLQRGANPNAHTDTAALGDIRLVSVVQLCSYIIERQHQAVDLCLSSQSSLRVPSSQELNLFGSDQPVPPASDTAAREALRDLMVEVRQRLGRLQQTLCI